MSCPRILLIDDHAMFRSGLRMVFNSGMSGAEVFEAGSLNEAINIPLKQVDVVLLDIKMNGLSGVEGISLLKEKWPLAPVLILSSQDDAETVRLVLERGADGFVSKAETADKMVDTIKLVLCDHTSGQSPTTNKATQKQLTLRQSEVLDLLYLGLSNKVIARQLMLSENTVRRHVQDILEFFQVATRAEAVYAARCRNLIGRVMNPHEK